MEAMKARRETHIRVCETLYGSASSPCIPGRKVVRCISAAVASWRPDRKYTARKQTRKESRTP